MRRCRTLVPVTVQAERWSSVNAAHVSGFSPVIARRPGDEEVGGAGAVPSGVGVDDETVKVPPPPMLDVPNLSRRVALFGLQSLSSARQRRDFDTTPHHLHYHDHHILRLRARSHPPPSHASHISRISPTLSWQEKGGTFTHQQLDPLRSPRCALGGVGRRVGGFALAGGVHDDSSSRTTQPKARKHAVDGQEEYPTREAAMRRVCPVRQPPSPLLGDSWHRTRRGRAVPLSVNPARDRVSYDPAYFCGATF